MLGAEQSAPLGTDGGSEGRRALRMTRAGSWPPGERGARPHAPLWTAATLRAPRWPRPQLGSPTTGSLGTTTAPRRSPALDCLAAFPDNALGLRRPRVPGKAAAAHSPQLHDAPKAAPSPGPAAPRGLGVLTAQGPRGCGLTLLLAGIPELAVFLGAP